MKRVVTNLVLACIVLLIPVAPAHAGPLEDAARELLKQQQRGNPGQQAAAIRQALSQGSRMAIKTLGKTNGFYGNKQLRIPMPKDLRNVEGLLRRTGNGRTADDFVRTLNRAAERAVPLAHDALAHAINKLTIRDAINIVRGPHDAATQYFRRTTSGQLRTKMLPIIRSATNKAGVTRSYKDLIQRAGPLAGALRLKASDIDHYIMQRTLDGLFLMIAQEEKRIRTNPGARTTELLRKVFG